MCPRVRLFVRLCVCVVCLCEYVVMYVCGHVVTCASEYVVMYVYEVVRVCMMLCTYLCMCVSMQSCLGVIM